MALLFAQRIIEHPELEKQLIDIEVKGKAFALDDLKKHGYECKDCRGNFIFVRPKHDANLTAKKLEDEKKILVHPYSNPFLKDYLRVSVGSIKSMKLFLDGFYEVDKN
jgi:histidinol-phosphate aminotransferase